MSIWTMKAGKSSGPVGVTADLDMVRRALAVLADPEHGVQLQYAPFRQHTFATFPGSDLDSQLDWVKRHEQASGIYYCLNPVHLTLTTNVTCADVLWRHRILIDIDRDKTVDEENPATDLEHEAAKQLTWKVSEYLTEKGWPDLPLFDSGNGWHLLPTIRMPSSADKDDETAMFIKSFLVGLANKFDCGPTIGREVYDSRRVSKLPGTWARRGVESPERPYRMAKIAEMPPFLEVVDPDLIRETIADLSKVVVTVEAENLETPTPWTTPETLAETNGHQVFTSRGTNGPTIEELAKSYLDEIPGAVSGQKGSNPTLWAARVVCYGFNFGVERGFEFLKSHYNPRCTPPWSDKELLHKCRDGDKEPFGKLRGWLINDRGPVIKNADGSARPNSASVPPPTIWRLPQLLSLEIPPPRWAVPGLMSEGLTILAGKPKLGKSWLALNLALTIAAGGKALTSMPDVEPGDVLYLALEDRLRRVQDRAKKLLAGIGCHASERLHIAIEWARQHQGGLDQIEKWMESVVRPTLVIIDVWAKFRTPAKTQGSQYEQDYETAAQVKSIGDRFNCSILPLHHCKKAAAEDAVDEISGTLGLAGAADGTLILTRARGENEANLFMTGRDIDENDIALLFDPKTCCWSSLGNAKEQTESKLKTGLIALFKANIGACFPVKELGESLKVSEANWSNLKQLLKRMHDEGMICRVRNGVYRWPADVSEIPE